MRDSHTTEYNTIGGDEFFWLHNRKSLHELNDDVQKSTAFWNVTPSSLVEVYRRLSKTSPKTLRMLPIVTTTRN
jgi:hypothetical protein